MKILLCGGLGFIGRNFLLQRPENWEIVSLDISEDKNFQKKIKNTKFFKVDLTDASQVKKVAQKYRSKYDICLYLAANSDPAFSVLDPQKDLEMTVSTLLNVITNFKFKKIIYFSSGAVYGGRNGLISPKKQIISKLPYALTNKLAEDYVQWFYKLGKIKSFVILRFFGAYGPYEPERKIYTNLVKSICFKNRPEFTLRGDGKNIIDAMYVDDAISGIIKVIKSGSQNIICDFCKGDHPSMTELVATVAKIFQKKVTIKYQGSVPEYNNFYASAREFEKLFGFRPKIGLEEGMGKLEEFLRKFQI